MRLVVALCLAISTSVAPAVGQTTTTQQQPTVTAPQTPSTPAQTAPPPDNNKAPEHMRTGWATLMKDSAQDFVAFPKRKSTWVILATGAVAALATHPADDHVERHIVGNQAADNFFSVGQWAGSAYVQIGSAVGLWAVGRYIVAPVQGEPRTNKYSEIGFDLIRAQILSQAITHGIKFASQRERPTGECCAFPSGHAAAAFAAASVLERHLGYRASWPALVGASYVAASRLVDNRHFLSDVMMGAAVGTASGWTVVGRRGRNEIVVQPVPVRGGFMIAATRVASANRAVSATVRP